MAKPRGFKEYLKTINPELTARLIEKAHKANRLAKICSNESKTALYRIKHSHLSRAIELKPDWFYIDSWTRVGNTVFLGVTSSLGFAFHIPQSRLLIGSAKKELMGTEEDFHAEQVAAGQEI